MNPKVVLKVVRMSFTNEWLVKVSVDRKYDEDKTYYTDDKKDAIDTAGRMAKTFKSMGADITIKY